MTTTPTATSPNRATTPNSADRSPSNLNTWQPPLVSTINERGPLPKHLNLPYLDELRLVADASKIAVKSISRLAMELKMAKFVGTTTTLLFTFIFFVMYCIESLGRKSFSIDIGLLLLMLPLIAFCILIRQGSIFLEKKYVKKTNFAPVVFHRYQQTVTITTGWKRKKTIASFHNVHAYIRYLSTPSGLSQPKLMLKIFDDQAPHAVKLNYFLDLGPADTEYELAAQWCVICQFMDTNQDYPYNPQFWNAAVEHHYPSEYEKHLANDPVGSASEESVDYYGKRLMDYALDQNALGMIGAEKVAGFFGVFEDENPAKRSYQDLFERQQDINQQISELENRFGIPFGIPPSTVWERRTP